MTSIISKKAGPVTTLELKRKPINALDRTALDELAEAVDNAASDRDNRVLVITGGIDNIFCTGGDLKYWRNIHDGKEVGRSGRDVFARIERFPRPTIAAINGHVIGDGLALALVCDIRIASETAIFRIPEAAYGFIPGWGFMKRLVACVGRGNASAMMIAGQPINASRAQLMGLVNEVVPQGELIEHTMSLSERLCAYSPESIRALKCVLLGGDERKCFEMVWGKDDWREGIDALISKRPPDFNRGERESCCELLQIKDTPISN